MTILPGTNGDHQTVSGPDVWVLLDHGDANQAYWSFEFTKWLTSKEVDVRWNLAQGQPAAAHLRGADPGVRGRT